MTRELALTQPFDLELSLTMGQAFRWRPLGDGRFSGVLGENLIHIRQIEGGIEYRVGGPDGERDGSDLDDGLLRRYFREDDDVTAIYNDLSRDPVVARLVAQYPGMRVLRQEPWECLVAYICSRRNTIARIAHNIEAIASLSQRTVKLGDDERCIFPAPEKLLKFGEKRLLSAGLIGLHTHAPCVFLAANRVCDGELNLSALPSLSYADAKRELMKCKGIGHKVADCIVLFAVGKLEAFPVDAHIRRGLSEWPDCPIHRASPSITDGRYKETVQWAQLHFGKYAGYAGQFIFLNQPK